MALDVKVKINLKKWMSSDGEAYPLILALGTTAINYTECYDIDAVETAGYAITTDTYKMAELMFKQDHTPEKIAVCTITSTSDLTAIKNKGWRQLVTTGITGTDLTAIMTYVVGTEDKMYFATVDDVADLATLTSSERIVGFVHTDAKAVSALVGEASGNPVGSITYKNLILNGITAMTYTDAEVVALHTAHGITALEKAGDIVTSEGKTTDDTYIDITDIKDYLISKIEYDVQKLLNNSLKVPYTNKGISMIQATVNDVLNACYNQGMIAEDTDGNPDYEIKFDLRESTTEAQRGQRKYLGGKFRATLAGAIHTVEIVGTLEI